MFSFLKLNGGFSLDGYQATFFFCLLMNVLIEFFMLPLSYAFSTGPPVSVCTDMKPVHGFEPKLSEVPYKIHVNDGDLLVAPNDYIQFSLMADSQNVTYPSFKGFLVQVREVSNKDRIIGSFEGHEDNRYLSCHGGTHNTITHHQGSLKTLMTARWRAPADFEGQAFFRYSVVKDMSTFWVAEESVIFRVTKSAAPSETPTDTFGVIFPTTSSLTPSTSISSMKTTFSSVLSRTIDASYSIYNNCGELKSCFGIPSTCLSTKSCIAVVSFEVKSVNILFEMAAAITTGYVSVGLSLDDRMGDDLTTTCYYDTGNGKTDIVTGYNFGYGNVRLNAPTSLKEFQGTFEDGAIKCKFVRSEIETLNGAEVNRTFRLLEDKFHILLAVGDMLDPPILKKHTLKERSLDSVALGKVSSLKSRSRLLIKLHGCFMILAWIGCAGLGMFLARYYKAMWKGSKCCGLDQWFIWHRLIMLLTWASTISGFCVIFYELQGWTSLSITVNPHALLGTITSGLCFVQPFIALMRCHPGEAKREIFNWIHWLIGNSAMIFGIFSIFFAVDLDKAQLPKETDWLIVAFVAIYIFLHVSISFITCSAAKRYNAFDARSSYQMNSLSVGGGSDFHPQLNEGLNWTSSLDSSRPPFALLRSVFVAIFASVAILFTLAFVFLIVFAPARPIFVNLGLLQSSY